MEVKEDTVPESNLETIVNPRKVRKAPAKKRATKKTVDVTPPPTIVNSFHLVAFPTDATIELDTDKMVAALNAISSATISVALPPRYISQFTRTNSGIKILPIPSASTPILIRMRDSYTDTLINALDFVSANSSKCQIYGVHIKRSRFGGEICQINILHGVSFKSFNYVGGLNVEKNENQVIEVTTISTGLFEATTEDIPDLKKYIAERFSL